MINILQYINFYVSWQQPANFGCVQCMIKEISCSCFNRYCLFKRNSCKMDLINFSLWYAYHVAESISVFEGLSILNIMYLHTRILLPVIKCKVVVEITNTMHSFAPLLYCIYWLQHVSVVVCHHQGASGSVWVTWKHRSIWWYII
jgi:hypothetical protein